MKIIVIGGGFAGCAAAKKLGHALGHREDIDLLLIDRNSHTTMLPSLPDLVGGRVQEKALVEDIEKLLPSDVKFLQADVHNVDLETKRVRLKNGNELPYDYLIFAPGSKTNFYGCEEQFKNSYKMDCLSDALHINKEASNFLDQHSSENRPANFVISGSGFTGMELATNLYHLARTKNKPAKVYLVELSDKILPMLTPKLQAYVRKTIENLGIEFLMTSEVTDYQNNTVTFKSGEKIENAFYCWCAGVMNAIPLTGLQPEFEVRDKRIIVDEFLRVPGHPEVFVAGDSAAVKDNTGAFIRRAVNFAYMQGGAAASNVIRSIHGDALKTFKSIDLGWVIPLYTSSIGVGLGVNIRGRFGIAFHYIMCGLKNYSISNFMSYLGYAIRFFFTRAK